MRWAHFSLTFFGSTVVVNDLERTEGPDFKCRLYMGSKIPFVLSLGFVSAEIEERVAAIRAYRMPLPSFLFHNDDVGSSLPRSKLVRRSTNDIPLPVLH